MLDEFRSDNANDYIAGFPDRRHRGFETVTYMLAGRMRHGDNQGLSCVIGPGGVQWMTAGRGIVHSEMPEQDEGLMWGFQLRVNLPAADKMGKPAYQEFGAEQIPSVSLPDGGYVHVIAGQYGDAEGPVSAPTTSPTYLDVELESAQEFATTLPAGHSAMLYVYDGTVDVAGTHLERGQLGVLEDGDAVALQAGPDGGRALLLVGAPLDEPVARQGSFVLNDTGEIKKAILAYQSGRF